MGPRPLAAMQSLVRIVGRLEEGVSEKFLNGTSAHSRPFQRSGVIYAGWGVCGPPKDCEV